MCVSTCFVHYSPGCYVLSGRKNNVTIWKYLSIYLSINSCTCIIMRCRMYISFFSFSLFFSLLVFVSFSLFFSLVVFVSFPPHPLFLFLSTSPSPILCLLSTSYLFSIYPFLSPSPSLPPFPLVPLSIPPPFPLPSTLPPSLLPFPSNFITHFLFSR